MKIELDLDKTRELNELYHTTRERDRKEPHLSDDPYCPMKAFNRIKGLKEIWSRKTRARFNIGEDLHGEFELPFKHKEVPIHFMSSIGHPDVVYTDDRKKTVCGPLEFKHTTLLVPTFLDIPSAWIRQVRLECVYLSKHYQKIVKEGWLAILELIPGTGKVYHLIFDWSEIENIATDHIHFLRILTKALDEDNPDLLTINPNECSTCQFNHDDGCPKRPTVRRPSKVFGCPIKVIKDAGP